MITKLLQELILPVPETGFKEALLFMRHSLIDIGQKAKWHPYYIYFLWRQRSKAPLRDHFVRRLSVRLSVCLSVRLSYFWFADTCFTLRDQSATYGSLCPSSVCPSICLSVRLSHFWFADTCFTLRDRVFIFGKCVPYDKTFLIFPTFFRVTILILFIVFFFCAQTDGITFMRIPLC